MTLSNNLRALFVSEFGVTSILINVVTHPYLVLLNFVVEMPNLLKLIMGVRPWKLQTVFVLFSDANLSHAIAFLIGIFQ